MKRKDFFKTFGVIAGTAILTPNALSTSPKPISRFAKFDMNGTQLRDGDLLLEYGRGYGRWNGIESWSFALWEYCGQHDTKGYYYDHTGELSEFWHVDSRSSVILDKAKVPKEILEGFYKGEHHVESLLEDGDPYLILKNKRY